MLVRSDESRSPEVSFVIPCLNEAESLAHVIEEIHSAYGDAELRYEVVVADNGSTDGSQEIALAHNARLAESPVRGYGAALITGIQHSRGDYVVMGDADGSYHFADAAPMFPLLEDGADIVMGNRFAGGIAPGAMPPLHKHLGNPILSWLGRLFFGVPVGDFHCGLRSFNRERINELELSTPGMEFASEMLVRAQKSGFAIREVPVTLSPDLRTRRPHLRTWRDGWRHLRFLLMHSPRWTFVTPSVFVGAIALFIAVLTLLGPVTLGGVELSYRTSIVASALAIVAAVAAWSAYIARAIVNVSATPRRVGTEPLAFGSLAVAVLGIVLVIIQFASWQSADFGQQPTGQNLLITVAGAFFLALGGLSFFFSLLSGLVRNSR